MPIWNFIRGELIDILEWNPPGGSDLLAWRFPRQDNEIKNGAKLIVREGQVAIFVNQGKLADVFQPGMYTLKTENLPILSTLLGWKYGFESPFKCEVYFLATRRFVDLKWGTASPVIARDAEFGMVRMRAFGSYAIQMSNPVIFLRQLLSANPSFETAEIAGMLRNIIVTNFSNTVASSGIPILDLAANLTNLGDQVRQRIAAEFDGMGLSVPIFLIENVSLPENVEAALDKRTSMGIVGDLDRYMKFQAAEALQAAAANPSGGAAGVGVGLGAGVAMAQQMMNSMQPSMAPAAAMAPPPMPTGGAIWWIAANGQRRGPFDLGALQSQAAQGFFSPATMVWKAGMAGWVAASQVPELGPLWGAAPPPPPPPAV